MADELVMVIDERPDVSGQIVSQILSPGGYRSQVVSNSQQGCDRLSVALPMAIILNLDMAGALDVIKLLRAHGRRVPVIGLVTDDHAPIIWEAFQWGVREFLSGPPATERLADALDRLLVESRLRREAQGLQEQLQSLIQQQQRLYGIAQAVTSPLDYQQVLNRLVEAAIYVTDADNSSLILQDATTGELRIRAVLGKGYGRAQAANQVVRDTLAQRVLTSGEPMVLCGQDAAAAQSPVPALLQVPLKAQGRTMGVLRVTRLTPESDFAKSHVYVLSILAGYAALAIENARLHAQIERELNSEAVHSLSAAFSSTLRVESILQTIIRETIRIAGAERVYISMLDENTGMFTPRAMHALDLSALDGDAFRLGRQIVRQVIDSGSPIQTVVENLTAQPDNVREIRAVMCIPIRGASGTMGAIYLDRRDHASPFTQRQFDTLTILTSFAAIALENARLYNQVEAERRKLEAVIRRTDQPVIVSDMDGVVLLMNYAARQALGARQAVGTGMLLPHVIEEPLLRGLFQQAQATGQVQHAEIAPQIGKVFHATVTPIPGIGFVAVMQDITEFKRLSELKSEFVATVSHDIRSPLSTVLGLLEVITQIGPLTDQQHEFLVSAQQEVTRLIDLTKKLLDLGYIETGIDIEMEHCNLRQIIHNTLSGLQIQVEQHRHTLHVHLPDEPVWIRGSPIWLSRVIENLTSNAIKYTLPGGHISVSLACEGHEAVLRVQDSGIGIAPQDLPHVFDRFFRVRSEQTRDMEGSGLGLAIVRSIVERHEGRVWVESEPGRGSLFGAAWPLSIEETKQRGN